MTVSPPSLPSSSSSSTSTLQPPGSFQNTSAGQQRPTLTNIHIRSVDDAKKLFYAVQLGMLPKVERRLDAQERRMLRPGNVYVWEEKGPSGGENGYQVCIERWTEGLSWSASRIRDDFLMYYENRKKKSDKDSDGGGGSGRARSLENEVLRDGERDLYVKQTYSVHRNDVSDDTVGVGLIASGSGSSNGKEEKSGSGEGKKEKRKPRKWHLNAYFTKSTEGNLNTIDSIPYLRDLIVPEGIFSSARQTKKSSSSSSTSTSTSTYNIPSAKPDSSVPPDESGSATTTAMTTRKRGREGTSVQRTYAPFPVGDRGLKPAPPPPPPTVVPHLRNQHPPPPPPVPPQQWHHHHQQSYEQDLSGGAFDRFGGAYASPPPPPPPPSYLYGPTNNSYVVSSPVSGSVYASSPSSSHANGNGNSGGQSTSFEFAEYGYAGPSQTFGGAIHHPQHPQHALPPHQQHQQHQNQHQQQQHHGQTFRQHHETSPLGSDSPVLSEFGSGGSGSGGSGGSTSWHTPSPRPEMGLGVGVGVGVGVGLGGSMSMLGGGGGGVDGLGVGGAGEEDLSGYMPMPPLRYSPDADVALPPPPPSVSSSSLNHANDDMRMMSLGDSSSRYGRPPTSSHLHTRTHSNNDLTFVATTINPDFLAGVTNTTNNSNGGPLTPTLEPTARRDRSRSTSSNSPFRRRPIQLPQLNVPNTDLSTGGAVEYFESDLSANAAYAWDSDDYGGSSAGDGGSVGGVGGGGGGAQRVALAPLHSLQRNHPYRRNPVDDRQLRMLGPGAR